MSVAVSYDRSLCLWRFHSRSCEQAHACVQILGKCEHQSERTGLRRKKLHTLSSRVAARGAARALGSPCTAGTRTHSQCDLRYKTCAQFTRALVGAYGYTNLTVRLSRCAYGCDVIYVCIYVMSCFIVCYTMYTNRYHVDRYACTLRHACMNARVCVCRRHIQRRWLQHTLTHSHIYTHILTHMHKGLLIGKTLRQHTFNRILASNAIRTHSPLATLAGKATHLGACGEGRSTDTRVISSCFYIIPLIVTLYIHVQISCS